MFGDMQTRGTEMNWRVIGVAAAILAVGGAVAGAVELPPVDDLVVTGRPLYMRLQWSDVDTAGTSGLAHYKVYRSETQGVLGDSVGASVLPVYSDTTAAYHILYWYEVHPVNNDGEETMTGNNQAGDSLMTLGDPAVEIDSHPDCSVVEDEDAPLSGTWQWAIGVDVNGYGAWMSIDPNFQAGDWNVTVPLDLGDNDMVATATGTEGRSATDEVYIARIPAGSGDPALAFTSHADGDFLVDPEVDLEGEVHNGACVTINMGDYLGLTWAPAFDLATWTSTEALQYGRNTFDAHATGSMAREATASLMLYRVAEGDPDVAFTAPEDQYVTTDETVDVAGTCFAVGWVELDGVEVDVVFDGDGYGTFEVEGVDLDLGSNTFMAVGFGLGANDTAMVTVYRVESTPPTVEITVPDDGDIFSVDPVISVEGTSENCGYVTINGGDPIVPDAQGAWDGEYELADGPNTITVTGYGADGLTATDEVTVYFLPTADPPSVEITSPADQFITDQTTVDVAGTSANCAYLMINDETVVPDASGAWTYDDYPLVDGANVIAVTGYGADGQTATDEVTVYHVIGAPSVAIASPADGYITELRSIPVAGTSENCAYVMVNAEIVVPDANGGWSYDAYPIDVGENTVSVTGYGANDQTATDQITVYGVEGVPPAVSITSPADGFLTAETTVDVAGTSENCAYIMIGDDTIWPDANGAWTYDDFPLDMGDNTITAVGYGAQDLTATDEVTVERVVREEYTHHDIFTPNGDLYNDFANFPVNSSGAMVTIYALDGQMVRELEGPVMGPEGYVIRWDGCDESGDHAPAGLYVYQLEDGDDTETGTVGLAR
jgi:hypothetical protein